jgi:hypothetical protein
METIENNTKCGAEGTTLEDVVVSVIVVDKALQGAVQLFSGAVKKRGR